MFVCVGKRARRIYCSLALVGSLTISMGAGSESALVASDAGGGGGEEDDDDDDDAEGADVGWLEPVLVLVFVLVTDCDVDDG